MRKYQEINGRFSKQGWQNKKAKYGVQELKLCALELNLVPCYIFLTSCRDSGAKLLPIMAMRVLPLPGGQVRSLVRELRICMLHMLPKKKKERKKIALREHKFSARKPRNSN